MEGYLSYISNIVGGSTRYLQPVFGITMESDLDEREYYRFGYNGMGPVRRKRRLHPGPNDGYARILRAQSFFDQRLTKLGDETLKRLNGSANCRSAWDALDAGFGN